MPNRLLREGILSSERIAALAWDEEVFYRRLMSVVDDFGRYDANPKLVRAACYPLHLDKVSDADIGKWLRATEKAGLVSVYPALDGKRYLELLDFKQQVRAKASKYPSRDEPMSDRRAAPATHLIRKGSASAHLDGGGGGGEGGDGVVVEGGVGGEPRAHATPAGEVCGAIRKAGIPSTSPGNPLLLTLLAAGATTEEFLAAVPKAKGKGDAFSYLLGVVKGQREDAAKASAGLHRGPMPPSTQGFRKEGRTSAVDRQVTTMNALAGRDNRHAPDPAEPSDADTVDVRARVVG